MCLTYFESRCVGQFAFRAWRCSPLARDAGVQPRGQAAAAFRAAAPPPSVLRCHRRLPRQDGPRAGRTRAAASAAGALHKHCLHDTLHIYNAYVCMQPASCPRALDAQLPCTRRIHARQASVCASLFERGWCTVDGLLAEEHARGARAEAASLFQQGGYSRSYSLVEETGVHVHVMHCDVTTHAHSPWLSILAYGWTKLGGSLGARLCLRGRSTLSITL